jgi:hypothetical protein
VLAGLERALARPTPDLPFTLTYSLETATSAPSASA